MNKLLIFILIAAFGWSNLLTAQSSKRQNYPITLTQDLEIASASDQFHLYLKGDNAEIKQLVESNNGIVKGEIKGYLAVMMPAEKIYVLQESSSVAAIHYDNSRGDVLLSKSILHTNTKNVHNGSNGLPNSYKGAGVIIGVIDAGLDLNHPDFMNSDSSTRVLEYWDQTLSYDLNLTPSYGYGRVYDSAMINAGLCPSQDQAAYYGHGTNTAGICASNDFSTQTGDFVGMAPKANLIIVSSNFSSFGWTSTVADAVDYIFERAEFYGMPCVINASLGTYLGSHDGLDFPSLQIDEDITAENGRAMVCAAGNSGNEDPYHLGYQATSDTNFTWFELPSSTTVGNGNIFLQLYGDAGSFEHVKFAVGADDVSGSYSFKGNVDFDSVENVLNTLHTDTLWSPQGNYLCRVQSYADSSNGTYRLQLYIHNIDSIFYNYSLMITGSGRFDLWSASWLGSRNIKTFNLPSTNQYPRMAFYKHPDHKQTIVSSWACSDKVITVGNYTNRTTYTDIDGNTVTLTGQTEGALAANSSHGPSRKGSIKPEITAPGDNTLTSGASFQIANLLSNTNTRNRVATSGMHNRAGGTSSASPAVAGIGALFFEKCPEKNWLDFKNAITQNPIIDQFVTATPNNQWGYGKVDALAALKSTTPRPSVMAIDNEYCEGDTLDVYLQNAYVSMLWNTGATTQSIIPIQSGLYYANVLDEDGCEGFSDTLAIFQRPLPEKPILSDDGASIDWCQETVLELEIPDEYGAYEWSSGQFTNSILISEGGNYYCKVSNIHGCFNYSDTVFVNELPLSPSPELQFKADGKLYALTDSSLVSNYFWLYNFNVQLNSDTTLWVPQNVGVYQVGYTDLFGCDYYSNELSIYALGEEELNTTTAVFPNPFTNQIEVRTNDFHILNVELYNQLGELVWNSNSIENQLIIPTSTLASGVYLLNLETEKGIQTIKLTK